MRLFTFHRPRVRPRNHTQFKYFTFSLQAVRFLCVSADLEAKANLLCKEALQSLTIALARTDTKKFWELLVAFFGANHKGSEEDDPWDFLNAAPKIPPPLPLTETECDEEKASVKSAPVASSAKEPVKWKLKISQQKDLLPDVCELKQVIQMYPADKDSLPSTGIPTELQVKREHQTTHTSASVYLCLHEKCQVPPFFAQSSAGIYSHILRKHLGIALACPYCKDKLYWNSKGWKSHMDSKHRSAPAYGTALIDEAVLAQEMMKATERQSAPPSVAPKKRCSKKKPAGHPQKKRPSDKSSFESLEPSSDEGTADSSPDSSSNEAMDTESASPTKKSKGKPSHKASVPVDLPPEVKQELDLKDMLELEEAPPAPFPTELVRGPATKHCKRDQD